MYFYCMEVFLEKIPYWLKNKYVITILAYLVYLIFFDSNSIPNQIRLKRDLNKIKKEKVYYNQQLTQLYEERDNLFSDIRHIEKFARETYYMKRQDEQIYIIEKE
jgi:cell division protein DivIC